MASDPSIRRYRHWYAKLLRLYPKPHYDRFGKSMEQTFNDLVRARKDTNKTLFVWALWIFAETSLDIVRQNMAIMLARHKGNVRIALATGLILLVPLSAMQFTNEVNWTLADFIVAGLLLFGAGLAYELLAKKAGSMTYQIALGMAVATALILIWANLAVGLIGSENNPANLMYIGVLAVALAGALIARFRPRGMAFALFATAIAQMSVSIIALVAGLGSAWTVNGFFASLWIAGALLFQRATPKH